MSITVEGVDYFDHNQPVEPKFSGEKKFTVGVYAGVDRAGENHVLIIAGESWSWKRTKHVNRRFNGFPVGQKFNMDSTITFENGAAKSMSVSWESFEWLDQRDEEIASSHSIINAAGKRLKIIKSTTKKLNEESIRGMTLQEIRDAMVWLSPQQKAAVLAIVISEVA